MQDQAQNRKTFATAKQLIRKNFVFCLKNHGYKKTLNEKKCLFNKKTPLYARLGSKQKNFQQLPSNLLVTLFVF